MEDFNWIDDLTLVNEEEEEDASENDVNIGNTIMDLPRRRSIVIPG